MQQTTHFELSRGPFIGPDMQIKYRIYTLLITIPIHESCSDQICNPFCEVETVTVSGPLRKAPDMPQLLLRILLEFRQYAVTSSSVNEISIRNVIYACFLICVA